VFSFSVLFCTVILYLFFVEKTNSFKAKMSANGKTLVKNDASFFLL